VRSLISLRKQHSCLVSGSFRTLLADGGVYAYRRIGSSEEALVVLNVAQAETTVTLAMETDSDGYLDPLGGNTIPVLEGEGGRTITVTLPALSGRVLLSVSSD
jgi:glycosidase